MKQKVIVRVSMANKTSRAKALKAVCGYPGVQSAALQQDGNQITVVGEQIDSVNLLRLLRQKIGYAELVSVSPIGNEKKDGDQRKTDKSKEPVVVRDESSDLNFTKQTIKRCVKAIYGRIPIFLEDETQISEGTLPEYQKEENIERDLAENRTREEPSVSAERISDIPGADYQRTVEERGRGFTRSSFVESWQSMNIHEKHVFECKLYFFLFLDCEFDKDQMVQLWVSEGIFEPEIEERMEVLGGTMFDFMVEMKLILPSRFDNVYGLWKYRLNKNMAFPFDYFDETTKKMLPSDDYFMVEEAQLGITSKLTKHLSLICEKFDMHTSDVLKDFRDLRTLILFDANGTSINHMPNDLFLYLKNLRTLDMHDFSISELPSSISYLESLHYLDVCGTPIKYLPESIDSLYLLQTLKLKGCSELQKLPKNMRHLIFLRHLDINVLGQLNSMPKGMGSLTSLQTLTAFLVGREDGCRVTELKNLVNLTGSFCISRLENISNSDEAGEAELRNKKYLSKLQLRWGGRHLDGNEAEDEILECLQPHFGINELDILFFNGTKLPTWISDSSFTEIFSVNLYQCRNCSVLPSLGRLPSLKFLEIYEMNGVRVIDQSFCRNDGGQESRAFPKLEKLILDGMLNLVEWTGVGDGDLPSLLEFKLKYCPKLLSVPFLSKLHSLKFLEIIQCTELQSLPGDQLPASLETLIIKDCPRVKECCTNKNAQDWSRIAHIPSLFLDHEEMCPKKLMTEDVNS